MMVSQGGFGASTSGVGVREIYEALFGVVGNKLIQLKQFSQMEFRQIFRR